MATVNFSVPDDVRDAFNQAFAGRNKSAIIADLMREAVEAEHLRETREAAALRLLGRRRPVATAQAIRRAREQLRA